MAFLGEGFLGVDFFTEAEEAFLGLRFAGCFVRLVGLVFDLLYCVDLTALALLAGRFFI